MTVRLRVLQYASPCISIYEHESYPKIDIVWKPVYFNRMKMFINKIE